MARIKHWVRFNDVKLATFFLLAGVEIGLLIARAAG